MDGMILVKSIFTYIIYRMWDEELGPDSMSGEERLILPQPPPVLVRMRENAKIVPNEQILELMRHPDQYHSFNFCIEWVYRVAGGAWFSLNLSILI